MKHRIKKRDFPCRNADKLFEALHNRKPNSDEMFAIEGFTDAIVPIGKLLSLSYAIIIDDQEKAYYHAFENSQPVLCASSDGNQLYIVAGRYKINKRGIV